MQMTHLAADPSDERSDEYGQMTGLGQFCQKRPASADLLAERSNTIHLWDLGPELNPWAAVLYGPWRMVSGVLGDLVRNANQAVFLIALHYFQQLNGTLYRNGPSLFSIFG